MVPESHGPFCNLVRNCFDFIDVLTLWDMVAPTLVEMIHHTDSITELLPLLSEFFRESEPILEDFYDIAEDAGVLYSLERR